MKKLPIFPSFLHSGRTSKANFLTQDEPYKKSDTELERSQVLKGLDEVYYPRVWLAWELIL